MLNPNLHQIHFNIEKRKCKYNFGRISVKRPQIMKEKNHSIYIDFFLSIVYDNIAKYGASDNV